METGNRLSPLNALLIAIVALGALLAALIVLRAGSHSTKAVANELKQKPSVSLQAYHEYTRGEWKTEVQAHEVAVAVFNEYKRYQQGELSAASLRSSANQAASKIQQLTASLQPNGVPARYTAFSNSVRKVLGAEEIALKDLSTSNDVIIAVAADQLRGQIGQFDLTIESLPKPE